MRIKPELRVWASRLWLTGCCVLGCCVLGLACSPLLNTPSGFVHLEDDDSHYDYRATTADGLVLSAREIEHTPDGTLEFWVRAIENELRARSGYALLQTRDVKTSSGVSGKQMRFGHDESQKPHLYYVAVFVTADHIYVVEAGGAKELVTQHEAQIEAALVSLKTD